jgi:hypothetical protein
MKAVKVPKKFTHFCGLIIRKEGLKGEFSFVCTGHMENDVKHSVTFYTINKCVFVSYFKF